jgi:pantothenate kinase
MKFFASFVAVAALLGISLPHSDAFSASITRRSLSGLYSQRVAEIEELLSSPSVPDSSNEEPAQSKPDSSRMTLDLKAKIRWDQQHIHTPEEAAVSASLYMNPATTKIAQHVKVTWEPAVADLLRQLEKVSNPYKPFLVGVVGIPGSGKSTSAEVLASFLDNVDDTAATERSSSAIVMPMDGYHYALEELAKFPDAADAIYRRGAPDTFDPVSLARDLERIACGSEPVVTIPGFDHAKGDPEPDQHTFDQNCHKIVICEGIYLLHDNDGWENIARYFDYTIYIDANIDSCIARLKERNKCIPVSQESSQFHQVISKTNVLCFWDPGLYRRGDRGEMRRSRPKKLRNIRGCSPKVC